MFGKKAQGKNQGFLEKMAEWDFSCKETGNDTLEYEIYCKMQTYFEQFYQEFEKFRSVSSQMRGVTDEIRDASENVREASEFIAKGATSQTSDIDECKKVADELAKQISHMSKQYQDMICMAEEMSQANEAGKETVENLSIQQKNNQEIMQGITLKMNQLVEKSSRISEVTNILYGIANQTNLLALNASIEAARAGESGRGFAVVADEVRKLSEESRKASKNINDSVDAINHGLQELKEAVDQSQETFSAQEEAVQTVVAFFGEIDQYTAGSIDCQKELMKKVSGLEKEKDNLVDSISSMANIIEESCATTEEVASLTITQTSVVNLLEKMSETLCENVEAMQNGIKKIKIVHGNEQKRKRIAMVFDLDIPFYKVTENEAVKTAKILGFDLEVFAPKSRSTSVEEMTKDLEYIVKEQFDALVISPISDPKIVRLLKEGETNGMKIIFLNSPIEGIRYESLVTSDGLNLGEAAANAAKKIMNGKGTALVGAWSDVHISAIEQREEGFIKAMNDSGIMVKKVAIPSSPTEGEADRIITKMLHDYPDTTLIYATNADWGILLGQYFSKHRSDIMVITIDYVKEMVEFIKRGHLDVAIAQRNFVWGSLTLEGLSEVFRGKEMKKYQDTGSYEVTKSNIAIYENRIK